MGMTIAPKLLLSKVMHKRLTPKVNAFTYGVYYALAPVSNLQSLSRGLLFGVNRFGILSLYEKDYGARDGTPAKQWIEKILSENGMCAADGEVILMTMPRIFGYAFNPVSFWLCHDKSGGLRAVLCEVNNTFREHHMYLCAHEDGRVIKKDDWLEAWKVFHVSPFLQREGHYKFRFGQSEKGLGVWIDYYDEQAGKKLLTSVTGTSVPFTKSNLFKVFVSYPLETIKVIALIHWQALKIWTKGIRYVPKPQQMSPNFSKSEKLTES